MSQITVDRQKYASLVEDSAKLVEKFVEGERKIASLETRAKTAEDEAVKLRKEAEEARQENEQKTAEFKQSLTKLANDWTDRGLITADKRDVMVNRISTHPYEVAEVLNKIAMSAGAVENGGGDNGKKAGAGEGMSAWDTFAARLAEG